MIRLIGVNIEEKKNIIYGLKKIYGIGIKKAQHICSILNIDITKKFKELNNIEIEKIKKYLNTLILEGDLKKEIYFNIKNQIELNSYKGLRHKRHLPVRGQRTRTNAKTSKKRKVIYE